MKLKFTKDKDGEISVKIGEKDFSTADYINMIKEIKSKKEIEAEYGDDISEDEIDSVKSMLKDINNIKETDVSKNEEKINPEDIPF